MTSEANDGETRAFFAERDRFGLPPDQLHFFTQGMLPAFDERGRILRSSASQLALSPNGNGGVYLSLQEAGLLEEMSRRGVTSVFQAPHPYPAPSGIFGVDNVLCHVADPTFVGFCSLRGADCGVKTIAKAAPSADPHEKVGVLASVGGKPHVVEYSEISTEMAEATREASRRSTALSGSGTRLLYGAAHICVNWFSLPFLRAFAAGALGEEGSASLPLHVARKKVPCLDPDKGGGSVPLQPSEPNAIKLELFIFDTFPHAAKLVALQVPREHEFAPVKNAPGAASDSPDTACAAFSRLCVDRLVAAGGTVKAPRPCVAANSGNGSRPRPLLEISPLVSYAGEGLEERVAGREFELPQHLC
ncbi:hypothetical protein EMIHUDRAFT_209542 [Emiliania huxleyi CCMP1516]|uniref:UDP-N-acetylglucosamine diphosphorylase n=2 Tax=Emiliania huxleyi TaxID=2903 RepID=A0A0D3J5W0_EMIH1|nr:hypothetical protein EMIHUDRAFT_209443 [Emiliania huxleyi CCMP1516]XP_005771324.1 hypothetical protein EMIHUDRAFT_209542 [Emiliania huxleyi CCMP1516]EOD18839.1 hypothetical protein EMIHUDRAFT_209443 [Emiliania huxleyi CCMP1516]EOD18895.1 hypothetical protein EMIHUDRAFT_209542 [Emiliania huxleyi CCMP1516]|eukprot:XP_005771268.1 hypothetical protein EMIHUDRAFT_209443 [Emiliania huxleyi CCMP1516]